MNIAAHAIAWTLIHFLWEGTLIAGGVALAVKICGAGSARVRYGLASAAMLAMLVAFGITLWQVWPRAAVLVRDHSPHSPAMIAALLPASAPAPARDSRFLFIAMIWLVGVCGFSLHSLVSWAAAQRLRRTGICLAPEHWQITLRRLAARIGLSQTVSLYESALADVPVVIGFLRPMILIPAGLLANFPADQLEYFLIHELAHIRRYDYVVNLLQSLTEDLLFYHPAVWWVSKSIREERENCCDDVVRANGDAREYASALVALEQNRWTGRETALAATGGHLMNRIQRLLDTPRATGSPIVAGAVLAAMVMLSAMAFPVIATKAQADSSYQRWLSEDVPYIITTAERSAFLALTTDAERSVFIDQFWERRNPAPGAASNAFREEHYRRIAYANNRFNGSVPGWKSDRGRMYIIFGPPDEIDSHPGGGVKSPFPYEDSRYSFIEGIGAGVNMEFVDALRTGDYAMTRDPANGQPQ
jgi:GWxTD domain-containing protein